MEMIAWHLVLSVAAKYRGDYLRNFYELGKAGLSSPAEGAPVGYLIPAGQGRDENVAKMIGALVEQGVEVYRLDKELHLAERLQVLHTVSDGGGRSPPVRQVGLAEAFAPSETPAGSYIPFLHQPHHPH